MIECIGSLDVYFTSRSSLLFLWSNWISCGWYEIRIRFWWVHSHILHTYRVCLTGHALSCQTTSWWYSHSLPHLVLYSHLSKTLHVPVMCRLTSRASQRRLKVWSKFGVAAIVRHILPPSGCPKAHRVPILGHSRSEICESGHQKHIVITFNLTKFNIMQKYWRRTRCDCKLDSRSIRSIILNVWLLKSVINYYEQLRMSWTSVLTLIAKNRPFWAVFAVDVSAVVYEENIETQ